MEKNEAIKQAAVKLRVLAEENKNITEQNEKLASDKDSAEKELCVYKTVCQMAYDGDLDAIEITEKVASMMEKSEEEVQEELRKTHVLKSGLGQIKQASASADGDSSTGESDPLTEFLLTIN